MKECDHKFIDSRHCLKCGASYAELRKAYLDELAKLDAAVPQPSPLRAAVGGPCPDCHVHGHGGYTDHESCELCPTCNGAGWLEADGSPVG